MSQTHVITFMVIDLLIEILSISDQANILLADSNNIDQIPSYLR